MEKKRRSNWFSLLNWSSNKFHPPSLGCALPVPPLLHKFFIKSSPVQIKSYKSNVHSTQQIGPQTSFTPSLGCLPSAATHILHKLESCPNKILQIEWTDIQFHAPVPNIAQFMATIKPGMKQGLHDQIRVQREGDFKENSMNGVSKKDTKFPDHN